MNEAVRTLPKCHSVRQRTQTHTSLMHAVA